MLTCLQLGLELCDGGLAFLQTLLALLFRGSQLLLKRLEIRGRLGQCGVRFLNLRGFELELLFTII